MTSHSSSDTFTIPKRTLRIIGRAVGILAAVAVLVILIGIAIHALSGQDSLPSSVDTRTYQAVFLSNGQVFFGKLSTGSSSYYELRHAYFLQSSVTAKGQPGTQTLIKLTKEVQTPQDFMLISRSQVVYVENLDPAGKAAKLLAASG